MTSRSGERHLGQKRPEAKLTIFLRLIDKPTIPKSVSAIWRDLSTCLTRVQPSLSPGRKKFGDSASGDRQMNIVNRTEVWRDFSPNPPADSRAIEEFEARSSVQLPQDYVRFSAKDERRRRRGRSSRAACIWLKWRRRGIWVRLAYRYQGSRGPTLYCDGLERLDPRCADLRCLLGGNIQIWPKHPIRKQAVLVNIYGDLGLEQKVAH
jgi:hypothetical protein